MTNALKGAAVAAVTGFSIAALIVVLSAGRHEGILEMAAGLGNIALLVLAFTVPIGAVLGVIAGKLRDQRLIALEIIVMALVPVAGVLMFRALGIGPELLERRYVEVFVMLGIVAAGPAAIGTIVLERWTRPRLASPRF